MNLKKKLLNFKNMLFNKKFVLLLSFIFILFIFEHKKLNAIDPVVIGKKYQSDFEFNASVLDSLTKLKTEEIYIDKDIRTKIKEKSKIKKSNEKRKIIKETNKIVERKKTYTYINKENLNTLNKVEILFNTNHNMLILFPSWLEHGVEQNEKATTNRISLAFNIFVKGTLGSRDQLTELISE